MMKPIEIKNTTLPNGETYRYRYYSGGEKVLVLVHGNLASSKFYDQLIEDLPEDYTVYAIDLRGFGGSTYNRPIDTLRDFAGDLKLFVDELKLTKFDLLGWSTGGAVCMLFCSSYEYLVNRLFLVASAGISGYPIYGLNKEGKKVLLRSRKEIEKDEAILQILQALEREDTEYFKKIWTAGIYNKKQPETEVYDAHIEECLCQKNLTDVYYGLTRFNISNYYNGISMGTEEVDRIHVPTIIVQGEDDLLISIDKANELKVGIGDNARLILIKNCGHSPMVDAPELLVEIISESTDL